ncbi:Panacea domain-containing protein [Arcicella rosea]|uniref:Putative phage-associated protein n=1 Tax=Arcicella rosea TaxID=502909 RepID=A0A841EP56_9BACT|nr:type II toxin-antitoxin system antitoxin SocA domain-containing protein [Arcicella rosea]MBB6003994.1 putative phage-associated protein [Arcicella rosea]
MFNATDIANYFINLGIVNDIPLTNMKLQKVLYIANGIHLAVKGEQLLKDVPEAWKYGPVFPSVYDRFKSWGNQPINRPQPSGNIVLESGTQEILSIVWEITKELDGIKLANWTHKPESPWDVSIKKGNNTPIDSEETKTYFRDTFNIIPDNH